MDYGGLRIAYNGGVGYVSASFVSETAPAESSDAKASEGRSYTGKTKTLYRADGTAFTVYEANDRLWYDNAGNSYNEVETYLFIAEDGEKLTSNRPVQTTEEIYPIGEPFTAYWENGNGETLQQYSDGYYYSTSWVSYAAEGVKFYGSDGTRLYQNMPGSDFHAVGDPIVAYWADGTEEYLTPYNDGKYYSEDFTSFELKNGVFYGRDGTIYFEEVPELTEDYGEIFGDDDDDDDDYDDVEDYDAEADEVSYDEDGAIITDDVEVNVEA